MTGDDDDDDAFASIFDDIDLEDYTPDDEDVSGYIDVGTLPRDNFTTSMREEHRRCYMLSQSDMVGNLVKRYGDGDTVPALCSFTQSVEQWLNGCRVALRRFYDTAVRMTKDDPDYTPNRLFIHYQHVQAHTEPDYYTMEMWLSDKKPLNKRWRSSDLTAEIYRAFKRPGGEQPEDFGVVEDEA